MEDVEGLGAEHGVEDGHVDQDAAEDGLEAQTEVHEAVGQTLVEQGQLARLGDEQISPLHHDDGDEVGGLRVLERVRLVRGVGEVLLTAAPPVERATVSLRVGRLRSNAAALEELVLVSKAAVRHELRNLLGGEILGEVEGGAGRVHHDTLGHGQVEGLEPAAGALAGVGTLEATEAEGLHHGAVGAGAHPELDEGVGGVGPNGHGEGDLAAAVLAVVVLHGLVLHGERVDPRSLELVGLVAAVAAVARLAVVADGAHQGVLLELEADAGQSPGGVAVVVEHHHVGEEARERLHDANLEVGEGDQAAVHEAVGGGVTGGAVHDVGLLLLVRQGDGGHHVGTQVHHQDHHGGQGQGQADHNEAQEGANLGDVGGERVADGLLQVVEDEATLLHAVHDGGEVVVHENHVSSLLGHVLAGDAHGHTNVTLLEGGGVVHTVTGHRHHLSAALVVLHNLQLVGGGHASEHNLLVAERGVPLGLARNGILDRLPLADVVTLHNGPLAGVHHVLVKDAHRLGNGLGGDGVVARHHEHLDARALALLHRLGHALAGGVDEGQEADEGEVILGEVLGGLLGELVVLVVLLGELGVGKAQHALAEATELLVGADELLLELLGERDLLAVEHHELAAVDDALGGALEHQHEGVRGGGLLVDGQLPLVGGVELDLEHLGVAAAVHLDVLQALHALGDANLGGVAGAAEAEQVEGGVLHALHHAEDDALVSLGQEPGVVAQGGNHLKLLEGGGGHVVVVLAGGARGSHQVGPVLGVLAGGGALDLAVIPAVLHGHAVLGQGAGLVRRNHGGGAKGLDSLQVLHQHVLLVHALGRQGKRHGHGSKQTLGHVGHDDTNHEHHVLDDVGTQGDTNDEEGHTKHDGNGGDQVNELRNLNGDGGVVGGSLGRETSNLTHGSVVGGADDDASAGPGGDDGGEEAKVLRLERRGDVLGAHVAALLGLGLTSQGRVVHLELGSLHEHDVRRDLVTVVQRHDIAGDKLSSVNNAHLAVASHVGLLGDQLREAFHDGLRFGFLQVGEGSGDENDKEEHNAKVKVRRVLVRIDGITDEAKSTTSHQQNGEEVRKLQQVLDVPGK
mmetsp:Transcript_15325/g.33089  ORF Transcript_15325/g.33089 Transcript_15325/m.33089 type:complete len:1080 (-) Transcript_15325:311-3550(-)